MKITGDQEFEIEKDSLYRELLNPDVLRKCIPGCKALRLTGEGTYEAELELGIAAVKGQYLGTVEIRDSVPPDSYTMVVSGSGGPGHLKASVDFVLEETEPGKTVLHYSGDADVGGKIAAIGQRMLGGVAKFIAKQFFSAMYKEIGKSAAS